MYTKATEFQVHHDRTFSFARNQFVGGEYRAQATTTLRMRKKEQVRLHRAISVLLVLSLTLNNRKSPTSYWLNTPELVSLGDIGTGTGCAGGTRGGNIALISHTPVGSMTIHCSKLLPVLGGVLCRGI